MMNTDNWIFLDKVPDGPWPNIPRIKVNPDEKWIKHVHCDGARFHVLSFAFVKGRCVEHCSEADCIVNKPEEEE